MPEIVSVNTPFESNSNKFNPYRWFNSRSFYVKFIILSGVAILLTTPVIVDEQNQATYTQYAAIKHIITPTPTPTPFLAK